MLVNQANVSAVYRNFKATWNRVLEATETSWQKLATLVPSTGELNQYVWASSFPKMREWVGAKVYKQLSAYTYTVENKEYEVTLEVLRKHLEDDQLAFYKPKVEMAAWSAAMLPQEVVATLLDGAFTNLAFDGQAFCDSAHPVGGSTYSNIGTKALSAASVGVATSSLGTGILTMQNFKSDEGRPLHINPTLLVVSPTYAVAANVLCKQAKLLNNTPNPYVGMVDYMVLPDLATGSAAYWFLIDASKPIKPMIWQQRKAPTLVQQTGMESTIVFEEGKFLFGAEARGNGGYTLPQLMYGSNGTT